MMKLFSIIILICSLSFAQQRDIRFEHLTVEDGLSANTVMCFLQDSRGFLWIGTYNGLNRYDGYNFTTFKNSLDDSTSISENYIRALCEDEKGNIWVGTASGGINQFIREAEKFIRFQHNPLDSNCISSDAIISLCIDKSGYLWVGNEKNGLDRFDINKGKFYHFRHNPDQPYSLSSNSVFVVYVDKKNVLWVGTTGGGLNKFVNEKKHFISFKHSDNDPESIGGNQIASMYEDPSGNLWIGTRDGGLNKFDPSLNKFKRYEHNPKNQNSLSDNYAWMVYGDSEGLMWIGTYSGGLNLFNKKGETFSCFRKDYSDPNSLSDDAVYSIYEDRSGILWFGTWSGGLNKYNKEKRKFITYSHNPNDKNSLSNNFVYAIYKDRSGILWVGTADGGLNKIEETKNIFTHYQHNPNDLNSISSNNIYSLCEDDAGNLWVSTDDAGLNKLDKNTNRFQHFKNDPNDPNSLSSNAISQIFFDSFGDLWIGTSVGGMNRMKKNQKDFTHYKHNPDDPKSVSLKLAYSFFEDRTGHLWIGTHGDGLMLYNRETDDFTHYRNDLANLSNSLSSNIISTICEDEKGILWIGTDGRGLNRFDKEKNQFKHYTEKNGLANNVVNGILYENGNLWISTGRGISKFDIDSETFTNYNTKDGLLDNEFNAWAYTKSSTGEMYFGGANGLNRINPQEVKVNPNIPPIVITNFQILHKPVSIGYDSLRGRTILEKSITETESIELSYDENILSFEIAALDFHNPEKNKYAYSLEGFDKHWIHTDASHRIVTYTNIDPGEYTLRVKGSNNDDIWNEAGVALKIIISPPWWLTWWSYMLYGFVIILVFVTSTRIYLYRHRLSTQLALEQEHAKKLEEVDKMKSNFYANISHEFRTPLMLILGPLEKLKPKLNDEESEKQAGLIRGNAKRLLNLINQLLDLSKLEAKKLKLCASKGNIVQFVKGLTREFESIAEQKDITLKIIFEKDFIEAYFDKEKMEKIITNVVSNAMKFTPQGGRITVKITETPRNEVEIVVRDSGIGIPQSELTKIFDRFYQVDGSHTREHEGTGIGLALTKEFVELHSGQIIVDSVEGHWTEVRMYFPLGREHLSDDEIIQCADNESFKLESIEALSISNHDTEKLEFENLVDKTIVLVVEDNPDLRDYIKNELKKFYHVEEAANGEQGLRKAEKLIPDLIVSDVMMPLMDGYEMTRKIRQDEKTSHIPIILLTAKSDKESKLEGLGLGADDYLTKPFDSEELLARIKNLIESRRLLQEKFGSGNVILHRPEKAKLNFLDQQFLDRVMMVIEEHIAEEEFSIEEFGKDVGMSRSQMHRKLKALTGKSTSLYLRTVRLAKAKQMIENQIGTISEISYQVGFSSPAYFSRCFKEEFGFTPSETHR